MKLIYANFLFLKNHPNINEILRDPEYFNRIISPENLSLTKKRGKRNKKEFVYQ